LAGESGVLGVNLPQRHFDHHKFHMARPEVDPGPPRWEAGDKPPNLWHALSSSLLSYHLF
jgi:hypothetical protein